jgi:hypothetical protein
MRTYSLEECFIRAYSTAAVVAQGIIDTFWPSQAVRCAVDRDYSRAVTRAAAAYDGAERLAEAEAEIDAWEPGPHSCDCDLSDDMDDLDQHAAVCSIWDDWEEQEPRYHGWDLHDATEPGQSTLDDVVAQLCQLTYIVEDMRNIIQTSGPVFTPGPTRNQASPVSGSQENSPAGVSANADLPPASAPPAGHPNTKK